MNANDEKKQPQEEEKLKGTFVSVMLLGVLLALSWLGAYVIFLNRG